MHLFGEDLLCDENRGNGPSTAQLNAGTMRVRTDLLESEVDEEWSTPLAKISRLFYDHESWSHAREILEVPTAACRKVGDEARSLASRHIIDRLKEKQYLEKIHKVAPRLRSAVELLSKPDADYVYPPIQFVVNQLREKYPEVYDSVVLKVGVRIPFDMRPKTILVSMAKYVIENTSGEICLNWGKFTALLGLCGALAVDSVEAGYAEGVTEVVDTFGLIVEQIMGEWILDDKGGGGWEGFIRLSQYEPMLSPVPRTVIILLVLFALTYATGSVIYLLGGHFFFTHESPVDQFWSKWGSLYPHHYCLPAVDIYGLELEQTSVRPANPLEFLYSFYSSL